MGDWETWAAFFLDGVKTTADFAAGPAQRIARLVEEDRLRIAALGRASGSATLVHDALRRHPFRTILALTGELALIRPTVASALAALAAPGIVSEC